jgi:5-formyltetrahydrofolate cyclo-ligase
MNKEALRKIYKQKRAALSSSDLSKLNDLMLIQFQSIDLPFLQNIVSYFPLEKYNEPDTFLITRYLKFQNLQLNIAYPRMISGAELEAVIIEEDSEFEFAQYDIQELQNGLIMQPNEVELIIVPLLCCDYKGNRVGYGKGYYDRYLANCKKDVIKIGLSFFDPIDSIGPLDYGDIPIDVLVTPDMVYEF